VNLSYFVWHHWATLIDRCWCLSSVIDNIGCRWYLNTCCSKWTDTRPCKSDMNWYQTLQVRLIMHQSNKILHNRHGKDQVSSNISTTAIRKQSSLSFLLLPLSSYHIMIIIIIIIIIITIIIFLRLRLRLHNHHHYHHHSLHHFTTLKNIFFCKLAKICLASLVTLIDRYWCPPSVIDNT